jgi:hypothetical protein
MNPEAVAALPPTTRCYALVGAYMSTFALMESALETATNRILGLEGLKWVVLSRNMGFIEKVRTFRVLANMFYLLPEDRNRYDGVAKRLTKAGEERNIIAHCPFGPSDDGDGVVFLTVSASSKLDFPKTDWSIDDFDHAFGRLDSLGNELNQLPEPTVFPATSASSIYELLFGAASEDAQDGAVQDDTPDEESTE